MPCTFWQLLQFFLSSSPSVQTGVRVFERGVQRLPPPFAGLRPDPRPTGHPLHLVPAQAVLQGAARPALHLRPLLALPARRKPGGRVQVGGAQGGGGPAAQGALQVYDRDETGRTSSKYWKRYLHSIWEVDQNRKHVVLYKHMTLYLVVLHYLVQLCHY